MGLLISYMVWLGVRRELSDNAVEASTLKTLPDLICISATPYIVYLKVKTLTTPLSLPVSVHLRLFLELCQSRLVLFTVDKVATWPAKVTQSFTHGRLSLYSPCPRSIWMSKQIIKDNNGKGKNKSP